MAHKFIYIYILYNMKCLTIDNKTIYINNDYIKMIPILNIINNYDNGNIDEIIYLNYTLEIVEIVINFVKLNMIDPQLYCDIRAKDAPLCDQGFKILQIKYIKNFGLYKILEIIEAAYFFQLDFLLYLGCAYFSYLFKTVIWPMEGIWPTDGAPVQKMNIKEYINNLKPATKIIFNTFDISDLKVLDLSIEYKEYNYGNAELINDFKDIFNQKLINKYYIDIILGFL